MDWILRILCKCGLHLWTDWRYVEFEDSFAMLESSTELERWCTTCGEHEHWSP